MKVCTEACLFGAWLADQMKEINPDAALDVGTGTGLLSLMLAQQTNTPILDAIELDAAAAVQASENFSGSPWSERLHLLEGNVLNYSFSRRYSLVFTNPPFFEQSLLSPDHRINKARHESELDPGKLVQLADELLKPDGYFAILLPYNRSGVLSASARAHNWNLINRLDVCQTEKHPPFRSFFLFKKGAVTNALTELIRIKENGSYSDSFRHLLRPYYLHL